MNNNLDGKARLILLFLLLFGIGNVYCQEDTLTGIPKLRHLIYDNQLKEARSELTTQIEYFKSIKNYDTLPYYIEFVGSYKLANKNWNLALQRAESFANELKKQNDPSITKNTLKELAWIYDENGKPNIAYKLVEEALKYANLEIEEKGADKGSIIYNMGYYAAANGDYILAKKNYIKSLRVLQSSKEKDYVFFQQIYNALGGIMWREGKMDSCNYYFKNSLEALKGAKKEPINQYFRPALVKMNIAVVSNILGKNKEAIDFSEEAIKNFQKYIQLAIDEQKKNGAQTNMLSAIDNLGVFYNAIGEYKRAEELITYSYGQKKKTKNPNDPNLIISKIILAQAKLNTRDFKGAEVFLDEALAQINKIPGFQLYWKAGALGTRGKVYEENNEIEKAKEIYLQAEELYRNNLNGNYNNEFLIELSTMAIFYAKNNFSEKAKSLAHEIYDVTKKGAFKNTLQEQNQILTIAETYFQLNDYKNSLKFSREAIDFKVKSEQDKTAIIDSILIQFSKPRAYLINAKSQYNLNPNPSKEELLEILAKIENGIEILEQRKAVIKNYEDLTQLISQNDELFNFAKKIRLKLYEKTNDKNYLSQLVQLHEASIYNRIRARLNLRQEIKYSGIPKAIIEQESKLKLALSTSLETADGKTLQTYFKASKEMDNFLKMLKEKFPKYYQLKYGSIKVALTNIESIAPKNTTVVRYIFIDDQLYALLISKSNFELIKLNFNEIKTQLHDRQQGEFNVMNISPKLHKIYQVLWQPIEHKIDHKNVIIIPDRELYNVSFESLLKNEISSFSEFKNESLLSDYALSYNFSLLLINETETSSSIKNDYVAFAPEFNSKMKQDYEIAITDSLSLDKTYLTLLPQPFSSKLAEKYARRFNGEVFTNENASKQVFINEANENKIIHIGTHAESNNISPELSRLIFAKNLENDSLVNNNSLYTYEIYNYNLNSDLAILTACETGKPAYQAGEGMISLSHAFNYAGSKSILTSLWKIDEKSSAEIVASFYDYLKAGNKKNVALQKAKLDYLSSSQGRTLAPQYWAGLVLIGDTTPIDLNTGYAWWVYAIIGVVLLVFLFIFLRRKK